jgi:tRNA(fMet)-specific endonuclease VapC
MPILKMEMFNRHAGQMCISSVTLAELFHGVENSSRPDHNLRQVEDFISRLEVLEYGAKAAAHYGEIRAALERKDAMIGILPAMRAGKG